MASTTFVDYSTPIVAAWLNDVNTATYVQAVKLANVTATEVGYLAGVTSAVQTQLDAAVKLTGNQTVAGIKTFSSSPVIPTATFGTNTTAAASTAFVQSAASAAALPVGSIFWFPSTTIPTGTLKLNGAAISRTTYAALFAIFSTVYGVGDGSTTFNLPDLRGEFIRGLDEGRGIDTGRTLGSLQLDAMQGHRHQSFNESAGAVTGGGAIGAPGASGAPISDGTNGTPRYGPETRPRNIPLVPCIKY